MTTPSPKINPISVAQGKILKDDAYVGPGMPGYDHQVLKVSRQITFTSVVPITSYPGMNVSEAVKHEFEADAEDVIETLMFIDERSGTDSFEIRTHVDVVQIPLDAAEES